MWRVTTTFAGVNVVGGGITRTYFDQAGGDADDAADAMFAFWTTCNDVIDDSTTFTVLNAVEDIDPTDGEIQSSEAVTGGSANGADDSGTLPPQVQGIVQLLTGVYIDGRQVRGRIYIPSMGASSWINGNYSPGRRAIVEGAIGTLLTDSSSQLVVWQRPRIDAVDANGDPLPDRPGSMHPVSAGILPAKTGVLRSRRD